MKETLAKALAFIRQNGAMIGVELLVNFIGPYLVYDLATPRLGEVHALMASAIPPIAWSLVEFARKRRVDAVSMLVVAGIGLSLLAFLGGGSVKFLQLREKLVTVIIGLVFLGSVVIGKPLIYELSRASLMRRGGAELGEFEALKDNIYFKRTMRIMTLVWGFGLIGEAALSALLVVSLSVRQYLLVSPVVGWGATGGLSLWTFWYVRRQRRKGAAHRAAAEAVENAPSTPI
jgi:hypothetical protein